MKKTIKEKQSSKVSSGNDNSVFRKLFSSIILVLRRLEFLGLYSYLKIQPSLGRRSSSFQGGSSIKRLAKLRITGYSATIALLFLSFATISPIYIKHTPVEAESGTATPSTLTFTSIKNSASVNLNVTSKDGTFATSTAAEMAQFSISTNNYTGYTLKLRSIGSITTLNGDTTNINTISTTTTKTTFENTTSLNNHWGYIPSHYNSQVNNNNSYYPAPTNTNAATIMVTDSANGSTTHPAASDTYTIGLGLRADYTNPSGTYTNNTFILEYVANKVDFMLTYSKGTISDEVKGIPATIYEVDSIMGNPTESGNTSTYDVAHEIDLEYANAPTRTGYDFVGWCDGSLENNGTECNGTPGKLYKDGEKYIVDENASSVTLYAVWKEKIMTLTDITTMQQMTPKICANTRTPEASETTTVPTKNLTDTRDNKTYTVSKLPDGNCWMTQNLALGSSTLGEITLTSADSDVSSNFTLPTPTTTSFSSSYYNTTNYRNYTSNNTNYYNWYTATAGTGTQTTSAYTAASSSICPKGWRLPNGSSAPGVAGEWAELFYAAGITGTLVTTVSTVSYASGGAAKRAAAPYNIPNTYGYFNTTGTAPTGTSFTYFWTNRTYSSTDYAWSTEIGSSTVMLSNYSSKYTGRPMRCVAHKAEIKPTITYDANGGSGAPSPTQASSASEFAQSITLSSTKPTKSGQSFAGWNTKQDGSGTWYRPSDTITTASDTALYAFWRTETTTFDSAFAAAGKTKVSGTDYYAMQDMSASICNNVTSALGIAASTAQLIDTRDNKIYWVSKLADGKCWMTQNLDYDLAATIHGDAKTSTTVSGWKNDYNLPYSYDGGSYYSANNGTSNNTSLTAITCNSSTNGGENCHYHIGNHYNWTAAINSANSSSYTTQYFNAPDSICPTGWKLPMGYDGVNGDFKTLNNAYGGITSKDDTLRASPLWFVRSGRVDNGSLSNVGSEGYYWPSTVRNSNYAYRLYFYSTSVKPTDIIYRIYGYSVRCVAQ